MLYTSMYTTSEPAAFHATHMYSPESTSVALVMVRDPFLCWVGFRTGTLSPLDVTRSLQGGGGREEVSEW